MDQDTARQVLEQLQTLTTQNEENRQVIQQLQVQNQNNLAQRAQDQASIQALRAQLASASTRSTQSLIDTRGIAKPSNFTGEPRDWPVFSFKYLNFASCVYPQVREIAQFAQQQAGPIVEVDIDSEDLPENVEDIQNQMYSSLVQLMDGESFMIMQNCAHNVWRGLEAWRRLTKRYDPTGVNMQRSALQKVLHPGEAKMHDLSNAIEKWLHDVGRYEQRAGKTLDGEIKASILTELCPNPLRQHLQLNQSRLQSYEEVLAEITAFVEQKHQAQAQKGQSTSDAMDIGAFGGPGKAKAKGKGHFQPKGNYQPKGKPKGKGKGDIGGKSDSSNQVGKGQAQFQGYCSYCWLWGHMEKDCRKKQTASQGGKGNGKGKGKAKPKGGKGKGKSTYGLEEEPQTQPEPEVAGIELCTFEDSKDILRCSHACPCGSVCDLCAHHSDWSTATAHTCYDCALRMDADVANAMVQFGFMCESEAARKQRQQQHQNYRLAENAKAPNDPRKNIQRKIWSKL